MIELALAWAAAVLLVSLSYIIAGPIWVRRHSLKTTIGNHSIRMSGAVGEIALVTAGALLLVSIDLASGETDLRSVFEKYPRILLALLLMVLPFVWIHGIRTALAAEAGEKTRLFFTYLVYGVYSTILFFGGTILITLMVDQFLIHAEFASQTETQILQLLGTATTDPANTLTALEFSYLDAQKLLSMVEDSMSPTFVLATGIFAINLALQRPPMKDLFMANATALTHITTLFAITLVVTVGGIIYVGFYSRFIETFLEQLDLLRPHLSASAPDLIERFSDIYIDLNEQKTLLGFITRTSNEWGGVMVVVGAVQWATDQLSKQHTHEEDTSMREANGASGAEAHK